LRCGPAIRIGEEIAPQLVRLADQLRSGSYGRTLLILYLQMQLPGFPLGIRPCAAEKHKAQKQEGYTPKARPRHA
jgi:hypothetical protein